MEIIHHFIYPKNKLTGQIHISEPYIPTKSNIPADQYPLPIHKYLTKTITNRMITENLTNFNSTRIPTNLAQ